MTSMRRRYVALTSLRQHVPAGNLPPPLSPNVLKLGRPITCFLNLPTPMQQVRGKKGNIVVTTGHEPNMIFIDVHVVQT